jgi:hypothetical protein
VVALLFTARYPKGLYDFVIGINRWAIRVRAYASLMRDEYPPFRLDMGPRDPNRAPHPNMPEVLRTTTLQRRGWGQSPRSHCACAASAVANHSSR